MIYSREAFLTIRPGVAMGKPFLKYFDPAIPLEHLLEERYVTFGVGNRVKEIVTSFLAFLRNKDPLTYEHSLRVGIVGSRIGEFLGIDPKPLLYGGLLHDIGKSQVDVHVLRKTESFSAQDREAIRPHVMDGYRMLRGLLDYTAGVMVLHHSFQENAYPEILPEPLHSYGPESDANIARYGKLLALVDYYDASHRVNGTGSADRTGEDIRQMMFEAHVDERELIASLYESGIFTTELYP